MKYGRDPGLRSDILNGWHPADCPGHALDQRGFDRAYTETVQALFTCVAAFKEVKG